MANFLEEVFGVSKPIIGMVHLRAFPGFRGFVSMKQVLESAVYDALALERGGIDGLLLENSFSQPFSKQIGPETVAAMAICSYEIARQVRVPIGIEILMEPGDNSALAVACCSGAKFIRAMSFNEAILTPMGTFEGDPARLSRYQRLLGADGVKILADIHVKYSTMMAPRTLEESAVGAALMGADAIIVTGAETGKPPSLEEVKSVKHAARIPLLLGSGITQENAEELLRFGDGAVIGSEFKKDGRFTNPIDEGRVKDFMEAVSSLRKGL